MQCLKRIGRKVRGQIMLKWTGFIIFFLLIIATYLFLGDKIFKSGEFEEKKLGYQEQKESRIIRGLEEDN